MRSELCSDRWDIWSLCSLRRMAARGRVLWHPNRGECCTSPLVTQLGTPSGVLATFLISGSSSSSTTTVRILQKPQCGRPAWEGCARVFLQPDLRTARAPSGSPLSALSKLTRPTVVCCCPVLISCMERLLSTSSPTSPMQTHPRRQSGERLPLEAFIDRAVVPRSLHRWSPRRCPCAGTRGRGMRSLSCSNCAASPPREGYSTNRKLRLSWRVC